MTSFSSSNVSNDSSLSLKMLKCTGNSVEFIATTTIRSCMSFKILPVIWRRSICEWISNIIPSVLVVVIDTNVSVRDAN